jgi:hypothetical protein
MEDLIALSVAWAQICAGLYDLTRAAKAKDVVAPRKQALGRMLLAALLIWYYLGCPIPDLLKRKQDPRLDSLTWRAQGQVPYKWWQFGDEDMETIMPVAACTHYAHAISLRERLIQEKVIVPPEPLTADKRLAMSAQAIRDHDLRLHLYENSTEDAQERCMLTSRETHMVLTARMPHLTTDPQAPALLDFLATSPHRDLLSAPSDARVVDLLISRLGEVFARVVAIVKEPVENKPGEYTLVLRPTLLSLSATLPNIQQWFDEQTGKRADIDPCYVFDLGGVLRSGLFAMYNNQTKRYDLLARLYISNPNEAELDHWLVEEMPFVPYVNPYPAAVHRRLPAAVTTNFSYPIKFEVAYYNLTLLLTNYGHLHMKVNKLIPGVHWLPHSPNMTITVDHAPLLVAPIERLVSQTKMWLTPGSVAQCITYNERVDAAVYQVAAGPDGEVIE